MEKMKFHRCSVEKEVNFKASEHSIIYLISRWQNTCNAITQTGYPSSQSQSPCSKSSQSQVKSEPALGIVLFIHILHTYKVCPDPDPREAKLGSDVDPSPPYRVILFPQSIFSSTPNRAEMKSKKQGKSNVYVLGGESTVPQKINEIVNT
jgi:hypothetical protein